MLIQKRILSAARQALKKHLKDNFEEDPFNYPSLDARWNPEHFGIDRECVEKFWEIMLKEHIVAQHPFGGYMHPRFMLAMKNTAVLTVPPSVVSLLLGDIAN